MSQREKAQALIRKAQALEPSNDPVQYVDILESAREADPYLSETFLLLGLHFYQTENWIEAVEYLSQYCQMDYSLINDEKKAQNIYLGLAKSCQKLEQKVESLRYIKSFIGLFPSSELAASLVEQVYRKLPDKAEWISLYRKGFRALKEGKHQEALELFEKSFDYNPTFSWAHYHMGLALFELQSQNEAIESFKKAREDDNEYVFLYLLGKAYRMLGKPREAEAFLKETLNENHYFVPALMEIGELYLEQKNIDKARGYIIKAIELDPEGPLVTKARELLQGIEDARGTARSLSGVQDAETQARRIIEKAEEEAQTIVEKARDEELNIILNAQEQAWSTLENAREEAEKEKEKLYAEFGAQEQQKEAGILAEKANEEAENIIEAAKREESAIQQNALNQSTVILNEANEKAGEIVKKAEQEVARLIEEAEKSEREITEKARSEENVIVDEARKEAAGIIAEAEKTEIEIIEKARSEEKVIVDEARKEAAGIIDEAKRTEREIIEKARSAEKSIVDKARQEAAGIIDEARALEAAARQKMIAASEAERLKGTTAVTSDTLSPQPVGATGKTKPPDALPEINTPFLTDTVTPGLPDAITPLLPMESASFFPMGNEEAKVSWDLGALNESTAFGSEKSQEMVIPSDSNVATQSIAAPTSSDIDLMEELNGTSALEDGLTLSVDDIMAELDEEEFAVKVVEKKTAADAVALKNQESEEQARSEIEERDKKIADEKTKREAEDKARKEAEVKARKIVDDKTKLIEAEERARKEALEKSRQESAERARIEEEEQVRQEASEPEVDISTLSEKEIVEKGDFEKFIQLIGFDLKKEVKKKTQKVSKEITDLTRKAEEHFDLNEWDKAMELYLQLKEKEPESEVAYTRLSEIYAIRGLFSDVITQNCELARIHFENGDVDKAIEIAKRTVGLDAMGFKPRMCLILINRKKGDFDRFIIEGLELARLYSEEGMGDRSMKLISKLQRLAPDNLEVAVKLADSFMVEGRMDRAEAQYRMLAEKFREAGRKDKAADALRKVKVLITPDSPLLMALGNLYMELQNYDAAETEFRGALKLNINDVAALKALGTVCLAKGAFRDSILAFNKVINLDPQDLYSKEQIGNIHKLTGNKDLAIRSYLEIAGLCEKSGDTAKALDILNMILEIDPDHTFAMDEIDRLKK